jgi:hypothetical protein
MINKTLWRQKWLDEKPITPPPPLKKSLPKRRERGGHDQRWVRSKTAKDLSKNWLLSRCLFKEATEKLL